nr:hypothetical protein [Tanacetum cinerariifolium]
PFVFNQDPGENSSQSPLHINHRCCYGCGDSLYGIFCQRCTCESCGNGAHYGYNCSPKVLIISNPEPCHNQNVDEFPQTLPSFHPTCYSGDENSFACDSTPNFVDDSPNVFNPPSQPLTDSYEFCLNVAHYSHNCPPQVLFIYNLKPCYNHDFNFSQNFQSFQQQYPCYESCGVLHETFQCQQVIFYEPYCENYRGPHETFQCQLLNQNFYEPNHYYNSNSFGFDQSQPSQFPVIHQPPQETSVKILHDHENVINFVQTFLRKFNHFSFFKTPKVLLLAWDRVSEIKDAFGNKQYKPEDVQELIQKLLNDVQNIHEELVEYINTPSWYRPSFYNYDDDDDDKDHTISPSPFPIPVKDSDSLFEKPDTSLSYSDNSLPKFETFSNHTEETSSGSTTTHADNSLPKYDTFLFEIKPDQGELTSIILEDILGEPRIHVPNVLPTHPTPMLDSNFILSDNSLPESEIFCFDIKEKNSGSTTIHADISLLVFDNFHFKIEPDPGELTSIVDFVICDNVLSATNVNLSPEDDQSPLFAYVVWIFC